jgi:hypothetical protein
LIKLTGDKALRDDVTKKLKNYLETDQACYIEDKPINYILKHENINLGKLMQKVFVFMEDNFDIKLKRENDIMIMGNIESEQNNKKIIEILRKTVMFY